MQISRRYLDSYNSKLLSLEMNAEQSLNAFISSLDWGGDYFALKENRNLVIDEMQALVSLYGDVAAGPPQIEEHPVALEIYICSPNN